MQDLQEVKDLKDQYEKEVQQVKDNAKLAQESANESQKTLSDYQA